MQPYSYYYFLRLWLLPFDEVKPRQVNTSKGLIFYVPFLKFSLRKPQMEKLQTIFHLFVFFFQKREKGLAIEICQKKWNIVTDHNENTESESISPPI